MKHVFRMVTREYKCDILFWFLHSFAVYKYNLVRTRCISGKLYTEGWLYVTTLNTYFLTYRCFTPSEDNQVFTYQLADADKDFGEELSRSEGTFKKRNNSNIYVNVEPPDETCEKDVNLWV